MPLLAKTPQESDEDFEQRKIRVYNSFVVSMTITGFNGEKTTGNSEAFLQEENLPEQIRFVFLSTETVPKAVLGSAPLCRITIFIDCSRPPSLDLTRLPSLPTPNESNFSVDADHESWFAAANTKLKEFFSSRATSFNWLHRAAVYDVVLYFIGLPAAIWVDYRLGNFLEKASSIAPFVKTGAYIYCFVIVLMLFRLLFSYSRWVFPMVEIEAEIRASPLRHRTVWGAIVLALVAAFLYDGIKAVLAS
jgi:hypothetical protein